MFSLRQLLGRSPALWLPALVIHGFGMKKMGRTDGGADFEPIREWDKKHPSESIGQYDEEVLKGGK